jgi:hypothetical protein
MSGRATPMPLLVRLLTNVAARVKRAWRWLIAKRKRPKLMLDILQLPMPKETLTKMSAEERRLFLLLGYASNQLTCYGS